MLEKLVTLVISGEGRWRIGFGDSTAFHYNLFILLEFLKSFKYIICLKSYIFKLILKDSSQT